MRRLTSIIRHELTGLFGSAAAFVFLGTFLALSLFAVFWVEAFFARNLVDVRPLFQWLPVLLIFLIATLTMHAWSDERRNGTLETLLAAPVAPAWLVLGKFMAIWLLLGLALVLTLPLPISIGMLGDLDWGPVAGGYLAAMALGAAYIAIGLYVSARSDNAVVSLILTVLACGLFYLLGQPLLTDLFSTDVARSLRLLGAGSRFESIARGVLDLRDLAFYLSVAAAFLMLSRYALERLRWADNDPQRQHRQWRGALALVLANLIVANLLLAGWPPGRIDLTENQRYTLSTASHSVLAELEEPLLIRGYFSERTHPLLAPLVPPLRDLVEEIGVAGGQQVQVVFVDPALDPDAEREAAQKYGIRPVPFQSADRHQAAITNAYFDLLIEYGDQFQTLNYEDLIEIKVRGETDLEVSLRAPEYDLIRAIRRVQASYRVGSDPFAALQKPVRLKAYISPADKLPEVLATLREDVERIGNELTSNSNGHFSLDLVDPDADPAIAERLRDEHGFRPMTTGLLDPNSFWFYLLLESDELSVPVPLPDALDADGMARVIRAGLQRFSGGTLKTVAIHTPPAQDPRLAQLGLGGASLRFQQVREALSETVNLVNTDFDQGQVPDSADLLLLLAPEELSTRQVFAVDQFLMRGGTVIAATAPVALEMRGTLAARQHQSGLEDWLSHLGVQMATELVLDRQNAAFPIPAQRDIGGFTVPEIQLIDYPFFADIRAAGLAKDEPITAGLEQITIEWGSPINAAAARESGLTVQPLIRSSARSWSSDSLSIQPDFQAHPELGFATSPNEAPQTLAVSMSGRFQSFFAGQPSPLLSAETSDNSQEPTTGFSRVIDHSPDNARIILLASNVTLSDDGLDLATAGIGSEYRQPIHFIQNAIEASLDDSELLALRARSQNASTLPPLTRTERRFWEAANYLMALLGLGLVWLLARWRRQRSLQRFTDQLARLTS